MEELVTIGAGFSVREALARARDAIDGTLILLKGPEVAARYPDAYLRPVGDLDLLAADAERAQASLLKAGFVPVGPFDDAYYEGLHHLRPLRPPAAQMPIIEVHRHPNWVSWNDPPHFEELSCCTVQSETGIDGLSTLSPAQHAVVVGVHSWAERPLRQVVDLIDVAVLSAGVEDECAALAERWDVVLIWRSMRAAARACLLGELPPWSMRLWARHILEVRARTIAEDHLQQILSPFWGLKPVYAARESARAVGRQVVPTSDESWADKLVRVREAVRHPGRSQLEQERMLGASSIKPRHTRRPPRP